MPLNKLVSMEKELGAQYGSIGFPMESELRQSENVVYVHAYTRDDGTSVKAHWRSKPTNLPGEKSHWRSKPDNSKNEGAITGGASEPEIKQKDINNNKNDKIYVNQEKLRELGEEKYKALYPDEIAGAKRGKEMSFVEAIKIGVNPNQYNEKNEVNDDYSYNCGSCVVAMEMLRRGYKVQAVGANNAKLNELMYDPAMAFINYATGEKCYSKSFDLEKQSCYEYLNNNIKKGERYFLSYFNSLGNLSDGKPIGHIICVEKNDANQIIIYDAQSNDIHVGSDANLWLNAVVHPSYIKYNPQLIRVDDKAFNSYYMNEVVAPY